jgi:ubiquinone/menaquinone biosynthesis C-methylase UbiE
MRGEREGKLGFYARHILPRLIDLAMGNKITTHLREVWIPQARGEVLEIGIGSGRNLPFYPDAVQHVYGVEPSMELQKMAREQATRTHVKVDFLAQSAEVRLPLSDASVDTVISTWTLCSIPNALSALDEMRRVLRPDGAFIFLEHGHAPDAQVAAWQNRLTPFWKRFTGGCHLNRKIDDLITGAGFRINEMKASYLPGPRPMTFMYQGVAARG